MSPVSPGFIRRSGITRCGVDGSERATSAGNDAEGSGFTADPALNTRLSIPGGFVVLNEQIRSGNGVTRSGITVNMIHVVVTEALIVGSASSRARS